MVIFQLIEARSFKLYKFCLIVNICVLFLAIVFNSTATHASTILRGVVADGRRNPIENAIVRLQGTKYSTRSDADGKFILKAGTKIISKYITAAQAGYYNAGVLIFERRHWYEINMQAVPPVDNKEYKWLPCEEDQVQGVSSPSVENAACQKCHPEVAAQWKKDAHSSTAVNPIFLSFFNGTGSGGKPNVGVGYKLDFPNSNGNCATCHVPILALENPFNADPNTSNKIAQEGINCDFCHKISAAEVDATGGKPGILSLRLTRPSNGHQLFYGPLDDVYPGEDSYHPLYKQSLYCAACHQGRFWGVLAYSEYQEWAQSSYSARDIHCQDCHMRSDGKMTRFALKKHGGVLRDPETIASHVNFGVNDTEFMREAISLKANADLFDESLTVSVTVTNTRAGHHYPTGNPMRNMILVVQATDQKQQALSLIKGERIPSWGGTGLLEEGNYAGLPGKGYAKVLRDLMIYPNRKKKRDFKAEYPAPHWRPVRVESDNRIPADTSDVSEFQFYAPETNVGPIHIKIRLIYRRAFKNWLVEKQFNIADIELATKNLKLAR